MHLKAPEETLRRLNEPGGTWRDLKGPEGNWRDLKGPETHIAIWKPIRTLENLKWPKGTRIPVGTWKNLNAEGGAWRNLRNMKLRYWERLIWYLTSNVKWFITQSSTILSYSWSLCLIFCILNVNRVLEMAMNSCLEL